MYNSIVAPELIRNTSATIGAINHTFHYNFRKFSFAARIVNIWNSLPDYVVDVNSVAVFKKRLDKFWADQNVMFDWTVDSL